EVGFQSTSGSTCHSERINWRRRRRTFQSRTQNSTGTITNGSGISSQYHCMTIRNAAEATVGSIMKMMIDVMILKPTIIPTNVQSAALLSASSVTLPVYSVSAHCASSNCQVSEQRCRARRHLAGRIVTGRTWLDIPDRLNHSADARGAPRRPGHAADDGRRANDGPRRDPPGWLTRDRLTWVGAT